jgi:O-antigen/teichoic acid export membrane protein
MVTSYSLVFAKRKQLGITLTKMYWLLERKSKLTSNKLLIYKALLKPIWTYGIQLWGTALAFIHADSTDPLTYTVVTFNKFCVRIT